ncbi:hypothetical protein F7Q99_01540 [Streptomyces kaniharaensis]|uniref:TniQ family protein n=1 Tax=Streptomyces kaniharaensis TaxID=212423 RepID=A0A6N7KHZ3_9ACTN|nr:hypothetical protein [Streptomyces kaniharaensis]MQS10996.1 hypothetical protein [Streptomyces kaniharaensis]
MNFTDVFRLIAPCVPGKHVLDKDAILTPVSLDRLALLSGRDSKVLNMVLPGQDHTPHIPLDPEVPDLRWFITSPRPQIACRKCTLRHGESGSIRIRVRNGQRICQRHLRWINGTQRDLSRESEITAAHIRYRSLLDGPQSLRAVEAVQQAERIAFQWATDHHHTALAERWTARAHEYQVFGLREATGMRLVCFPETVALAEILADPQWRRHVAMALDLDLGLFYEHVADKVGATLTDDGDLRSHDPLARWVEMFRGRHQDRRRTYWANHGLGGLYDNPLPHSCHFA